MNEQLVERYYQDIFHYTYFLVGNRERAEDLTQDAFVKALNSQKRPNDEMELKKWLITIAKNTVYDAFKRDRILKFIQFDFSKSQKAVSNYEPENWVQTNEETLQLYKAIGQLPMDYRQAIILRKIEGFSIKETADILKWNESKVKNATERGLKKLAELIGRDDR